MSDPQPLAPLEPGGTPASSSREVAALLAGFLALALTVLVCAWIGAQPEPATDVAELRRLFIVDPVHFRPEPNERHQFLAALLLFPLSFWALYAGLARALPRRIPDATWRRAGLALGLLAAGLVLALAGKVLFAPDREVHDLLDLYVQHLAFRAQPWLACLWLPVCALIAWYSAPEAVASRRWLDRALKGLWLAAGGVLLTVLASLFAFTAYRHLHSLTHHNIGLHFSAVFHAVVQVYFGQGLLVDLPNQYGLYPHFLEPLFRLTGLTELTFTLTMGALLVLAWGLLGWSLRASVRHFFVALAGFTALCLLIFLPKYVHLFQVRPACEPYYQYQPLRLLFPCVALCLAQRYFSAPSRVLYWVAMPLFSAAVWWNTDTGLVIVAAWVLALAYHEWCTRGARAGSRALLRHGLTACGCLLLVSGACVAYLRLRYGAWPDLGRLFEYQRFFYVNGLYLFHMPLWSPWMLLAVLYAVGLCRALWRAANGRSSARQTWEGFIVLLGCGLFGYYQGRSQSDSLLFVAYPGVLLLTLWADEWLTALRARTARPFAAHALGALAALALAWLMLDALRFTPALLQRGLRDAADTARGTPRPGEERLAWAAEHSSGRPLWILSRYGGSLHLAARAPAPRGVPGFLELVLRRDWEQACGWARHPPPRARIIIETEIVNHPSEGIGAELMNAAVLDGYRVESVSPRGELLLLAPPQADARAP